MLTQLKRSSPMFAMIRNMSVKTPVVMATNHFYSKTKLAADSQDRQTLKCSC